MNMSTKKSRRSIKNLLLQPAVQLRFGIYATFLSVIFSIAVLTILYINILGLSDIVATITGIDSEIRNLFHSYIITSVWWIISFLILFVISSLIFAIISTHRLVGPTVAFRNHIDKLCKGQFDQRVRIRKYDAFHEVADELNRLSAYLQENFSTKEEKEKPSENKTKP